MEIEPPKSSKPMSTVRIGCSPIQSKTLFSSCDSIALVRDLFVALHVLLVVDAFVRAHVEVAVKWLTARHTDEVLRVRGVAIFILTMMKDDLPVGTRPTLADELQFFRLDSFVRALCHKLLLNFYTTNSNGAEDALVTQLEPLKDRTFQRSFQCD